MSFLIKFWNIVFSFDSQWVKKYSVYVSMFQYFPDSSSTVTIIITFITDDYELDSQYSIKNPELLVYTYIT